MKSESLKNTQKQPSPMCVGCGSQGRYCDGPGPCVSGRPLIGIVFHAYGDGSYHTCRKCEHMLPQTAEMFDLKLCPKCGASLVACSQ